MDFEISWRKFKIFVHDTQFYFAVNNVEDTSIAVNGLIQDINL